MNNKLHSTHFILVLVQRITSSDCFNIMSDALNLHLKEMKKTQKRFKWLGTDIFSEKIKINFMTFYLPLAIIFYFICELYSILTFQDNVFYLILSLLTLGYGIQVR